MQKLIQEEITEQKNRGVFLVLTGPTASGKDALLTKLQERIPDAIRIITTTSREMRPGESEGKPYYFLSREEFEQKIANHEFFEWVEFRSHLYGTQKKTIEDAVSTNKDVILKIEAKGVKNIKDKVKHLSSRSVFIFLTASTIETLEKRVREDEKGIKTERWNESLAFWEMEQYEDCEYLVVNDNGNLEKAVEGVLAITNAKRLEVIRNE